MIPSEYYACKHAMSLPIYLCRTANANVIASGSLLYINSILFPMNEVHLPANE
jgi:hypothetical protein